MKVGDYLFKLTNDYFIDSVQITDIKQINNMTRVDLIRSDESTDIVMLHPNETLEEKLGMTTDFEYILKSAVKARSSYKVKPVYWNELTLDTKYYHVSMGVIKPISIKSFELLGGQLKISFDSKYSSADSTIDKSAPVNTLVDDRFPSISSYHLSIEDAKLALLKDILSDYERGESEFNRVCQRVQSNIFKS